jgi:hypothetical protein
VRFPPNVPTWRDTDQSRILFDCAVHFGRQLLVRIVRMDDFSPHLAWHRIP